MQEKYPINDIIKQRLLELNKNNVWLASAIGRSDRWLYNSPEIDNIDFGVLLKLSEALKFDFVADYRKSIGEDLSIENKVSEHATVYEAQPQKLLLQVTLKATLADVQNHYGEMLRFIEDEGRKKGFEIVKC